MASGNQRRHPEAPPVAASTNRGVRGPGRRLHGAIARKLGVAIVSGQYPPGTTLPGEVAFSAALNVSRSAYREAVQVLAAKGLVASRTKAGTCVLPRSRWHLLDPDVLAWAFAGEPDTQFVRDLFELRAIVEPAAAGLAARRRDPADLRAMKESLALMRRHTLATAPGRAADRDFHHAILVATKNDALQVLGAGIGAAVNWTTEFKQRSRALPRNPIPDHVRVYHAIAGGDAAAAAQAMCGLVERAREDTRELTDGTGRIVRPLRPRAGR
jgi:DNA-binding FadR family transcriptional regulator